MRRGRVPPAALMALAATLAWGQEYSIRMDGGPSWRGFSIRFSSKVEPDPNGASRELGGTVIDLRGGVVGQRFIDDPAHKRSFGYDVRLRPSADGSTAEIRIEPLHAAKHAVQNGWTHFGLPAGLPKYPVIPNLRVGDTRGTRSSGEPVHQPENRRLHDAGTRARTGTSTRLLAGGCSDVPRPAPSPVERKAAGIDSRHSGGSGRRGRLALHRGRGRFVFSLFPNQKLGFRDSGMVAANTLTFRDGTTEFRVECESAVAPGEGPYNLYVVHEPGWRPRSAPPRQNIQFGSADRPESVVEKK